MVTVIVTRSGQVLYSALNHVAETEAVDVEPLGTVLGTEFAATVLEPTPTLGVPVVGVSVDHRAFIERQGQSYLGCTDPFDHLRAIDPDDVVVTEWYNNAHLAVVEFPWQDMGGPKALKNFHEVALTIERDSRAYVGIAIETDANTKTVDARRSYRWFGLAFGRDTIRIPCNRVGRKIRVRIVAVIFNAGRLLVRDVTVGYTVGGTD